MADVPPQIRDFFASGKVDTIATNLAQKYRLHVDQAAIVEREIILLLLGLETPQEFTQALTEEARLSQQVISGIMQDVNTQIFVPLREQIRSVTSPASPGATQSTTATPAPPRPVNVPVPKYYAPRPFEASGVVGPPPQSPRYPRAGNELPAGLRFAQGNPAQRPVPPARPTTATPAPPAGGRIMENTAKPVSSDTLLPDHEEPHIDIRDKVQGVSPFPAETPLRQALRAVTPPQNLPGALPPPPTAPTQPSIPVRKPTDTDPYREPIE